ncbi:MAG TPA: hypothetical protein VMR34_02405 [Candidatus Saccharimonadales bacterium]|nr:hypothetical protein [Candidatus Saccharimonadales bacterium]
MSDSAKELPIDMRERIDVEAVETEWRKVIESGVLIHHVKMVIRQGLAS